MAGAAARLLVDIDDDTHSKSLKKHLRLLERNREGLGKKHRRPVIEAVVRAARRDLESETFEATCKKRIEPFNATESAMKHLWSGTLGEESGDSNGAAASSTLLAGLPLQLANCSSSALHQPWQRWRLTTEARTPKGSGPCQGLCLAHRFSLEAAPGLCLSLGTTRTPRNPFQNPAI